MKNKIAIFFLIIIACSSIIGWGFFEDTNQLNVLLENSRPYIGTDFPNKNGYDGYQGLLLLAPAGKCRFALAPQRPGQRTEGVAAG